MATITSATLANEYQKYFSKKLISNAKQKTVLEQFAQKQSLPKNVGAKIISFFRRTATVSNSSGLVDGIQALTEGVPISTFVDKPLVRLDIPLIQYGEACKVTDIVAMTDLFDALEQNIEGMSDDAALYNDSIVRNSLVTASMTGITQNTATGTTTEYIGKLYAQSAANFAALAAASTSGGKIVATDFLRAVTQLKLNRAPMWGGRYVAVIIPQVSHDLMNDPDWIDANNYGDPKNRFRGELGELYGCRFVEQTNPYVEDGGGSEGTYVANGTASNRIYRSWVLGKESVGITPIEGDSPFSPRVMIVPPGKATKDDPLGQFGTAGWKAYWGSSALNPSFAISISSKTEFVGT